MNNFDSFFDNLFPLRPLTPFVQSVLPTVFDDSLSYLETLGKVVKALNDSTSNVNTLEQAVRAFAEDLAQYENLAITPVEITYNSGSGAAYSASMTYADIVSALGEGHTVIMHVSGSVYDSGIEFYSAALHVTTVEGVHVLYWDSPVYTVDDNTVIYRAFINENNVPGVMRRVIGGGGADVLLIHYDSEQNTADKSFSDIVSAIEAEKPVVLIADNQIITDLKWSTDITAEEVETISDLYFHSAYVVTAPSGFNLLAVNYSLYSDDTWEKDSYSFPNDTRVNSMIDTKLSQYEGTSAIARLEYNETTGAVTRRIGGVVTDMTGYYINTHYNISVAGIMPILDGYTPGQSGDATFSLYMPVNYGVENGADVARFYRVYAGNIELVTVPAFSNIATKTVTPIGGSAPFKIPITASGDTYSTTATAAEILANAENCFISLHGTNVFPDSIVRPASNVVGITANITNILTTHDNTASIGIAIISVFVNNGTVTVTVYPIVAQLLPDVTASDNGKFLRVVSGAWEAAEYASTTPRIAMTASDTTPTIDPNKLYVFPEMAALEPTFAAPTDGAIANEYHFIFTSGATATTLTLPASVNKPDGFTVDANMIYKVSILENCMTAMSWEWMPT